MLQIAIPEDSQLIWVAGTIGFVFSILLSIILYFRKDASSAAKYYAIGSAIAFHVGGLTSFLVFHTFYREAIF